MVMKMMMKKMFQDKEADESPFGNMGSMKYGLGPTSDLYSLPHDTPTTSQFPYTFDCYAGYTYDELSSGSTGTAGYTSDYEAAATEGYTTSFASYGTSGNYVSSYLSDGVCSA